MGKEFIDLLDEVVAELKQEEEGGQSKKIGSQSVEVGAIFDTTKSGKAVIIKYRNSTDVTVKFLDTGTIKNVHASAIRRGSVLDPYARNAFGGCRGDSTSSFNGKCRQEYAVWHEMLARVKNDPAYSGAVLSEEFLVFSNFSEWYNPRKSNYPDGVRVAVESDILTSLHAKPKGYSSDFSLVLPQALNLSFSQLMRTLNSVRNWKITGDLPRGISSYNRRQGSVLVTSKKMNVVFDDVEDAVDFLVEAWINCWVSELNLHAWPYLFEEDRRKLFGIENWLRNYC